MTRCSVRGTHIDRVGVVYTSANRITFDEDVAHDLRFVWFNDNRNVEHHSASVNINLAREKGALKSNDPSSLRLIIVAED
ncbi:uncharacterized protein Bfra_005341 [Botrytis fragariae]|uniref:Uncharacterized protein n=1 Tax=Botrytis fragariae TaxID=1964551 RepID=A0A8H6AUT2_9HELO|nr:uncharacterized protein Bfra_005341 [Botrytis fragariae]KAF5873874.1 hypothetical protein Bfra_005341 [Botrytis fragariae]